jgi:hypothetical protein
MTQSGHLILRLKPDFKCARKAFSTELEFGPAEPTIEGTLYQRS